MAQRNTNQHSNRQGKFWLLTIPHHAWGPAHLPASCQWIKGQVERGENTEYLHWQLVACFKNKTRLAGVKNVFGSQCHAELSKSAAANEYVHKDDTAVEGTRFEFGQLPFKRNSGADWTKVKEAAKRGALEEIDAEIFIKHYRTLKTIAKDYMQTPDDLAEVCGVWIHGPPGVGKSHKARQDYPGSYMKMCNKWWDGYQQQDNVIIDDFDMNHKVLGHHLKIWADRYAFIAETKGYAVSIRPKKIVITSNYRIEDIFVDDMQLQEALKRRFHVIFVPFSLH